MSEKHIAAVVLASGRSSRMGAPKQLLEVDGQTLLRRTVETVLAAPLDLTVVVSQHFDTVADLPVIGADFVHEPKTLSDSIKNGLHAIHVWEKEHNRSLDAALFLPCDLPLLSGAHLRALIAAYQENIKIVASRYAGARGAPMLFDRALWHELNELNGDSGGRQIIARHENVLACVDLADGQFDLDTPEDVAAFRARQS